MAWTLTLSLMLPVPAGSRDSIIAMSCVASLVAAGMRIFWLAETKWSAFSMSIASVALGLIAEIWRLASVSFDSAGGVAGALDATVLAGVFAGESTFSVTWSTAGV